MMILRFFLSVGKLINVFALSFIVMRFEVGSYAFEMGRPKRGVRM